MAREVTLLVNEKKSAGEYLADWDASGLANGIYFCRLQSGLLTVTQKLVLKQ